MPTSRRKGGKAVRRRMKSIGDLNDQFRRIKSLYQGNPTDNNLSRAVRAIHHMENQITRIANRMGYKGKGGFNEEAISGDVNKWTKDYNRKFGRNTRQGIGSGK